MSGPCIEGLEVFRKVRMCGLTPSVGACDALVDVLQLEDKITLARWFYGAMVRADVSEDRVTLSGIIISKYAADDVKLLKWLLGKMVI